MLVIVLHGGVAVVQWGVVFIWAVPVTSSLYFDPQGGQ